MNRHNIRSHIVFAAADGAASKSSPLTPAPVAVKPTVKILGISTAVKMPENVSKRGSKTKYEYAKLEIGQSIGIQGRTATSLNSTVSSWNRVYRIQRKDETGKLLFEQTEIKDQAGNVTATVDDRKKPITDETRHFFAVDVDAKTDPENASCRIFRDK